VRRYESLQQQLLDKILHGPGAASKTLRRAVLERPQQLRTQSRDLPAPVAHYVDTVARHAYKITDADVTALRQAGHSDDAIFEITVAAAVGAAFHRLDRGLAALRSEQRD
jgi:hypothetical protein